MSEPKDILNAAMDSELEALEQYLTLARQVRGAGATELFLHLAQDELVHFKTLKAWATRTPLRRQDPHDTGWDRLLSRLPEGRPSTVRGKEHLDILKLALTQEEKAEALYRERAGAEAGSGSREMWLGLAAMERSHADILKAQIAEIERSGYWLDVSDLLGTAH